MNTRTSVLIVAALLASASILAHTTSSPNVKAANQDSATAQSTELAEAVKLSFSVVQLYNKGSYEQALPLAKRALQIREKALGPEDPLVRGALFNLAEIYLALRKYDEAHGFFERVVKIYEATSGGDLRLASVLDQIAFIQYQRGSFNKTEDSYQRALQIRETIDGPETASVAKSVLNLAEFYQLRDNYKKAETMYQRLVLLRKKSSFTNPQGLVEALDRYACLLRKTQRRAEAAELEARAFGPPPGPPGDSGFYDDAGIEANVLNGKAISLPRPAYPAEARAARASGTVTVRVTIDETGNVIRACAVSGPRLLMRESEAAAYRSKFTPTKLSGMPLKVMGVITYNYVMR